MVPRGKVIAELGFGFWRFLLTRKTSDTLWPDLAGAFPHAPSRALHLVEDPVKRLHKLRNRIAHHEGVWQQPLKERRDDLHTVLNYLRPAAAAWVADHGRTEILLSRRPL